MPVPGRHAIVLLALLALGCSAASEPDQRAADQGRWHPVVDLRDAPPDAPPGAVDSADADRILDLVGEAAAGHRVESILTGSFTTAGRSQELALLLAPGPAAIHAGRQGGAMVAVVEDGQRQARAALPDGSGTSLIGVLRQPDGRDLLLVRGDWMHMGESGTTISVFAIGADSIALLARFDEARHHACGMPGREQVVRAERIDVDWDGGGARPRFRALAYQAPCGPEAAPARDEFQALDERQDA